MLNGCRQGMFASKGLPATVKTVRRHAEGCKSFEDLVGQAPVALDQVQRGEMGDNKGWGESVVLDEVAEGGERGKELMHVSITHDRTSFSGEMRRSPSVPARIAYAYAFTIFVGICAFLVLEYTSGI